MNRAIIIIIIFFTIFSCQEHNSPNDSFGMYPEDKLEEEMDIPRTRESPIPPSPQSSNKIIKTGSIELEVDDLQFSKTRIDSILTQSSGYYEKEDYYSHYSSNSYSLVLRIPNQNFDEFVKQIEKGIGKIKSKSIQAKDVTERYTDLTIRLENNLAYLQQYKEILKKAKSVKDILEVQEKIRKIEEEIESKKGSLKYLDDKVKFSTLSIELTSTVEVPDDSPRFGTEVFDSFKNGGQMFLDFVLVLINLWPFLIMVFLMFFGVRKLMKRKLK